jgi:hypothetical protein
MEQSRYLRPIRRGEYDLVNISLIGHDPTTGRTYEECHAEWKAELDKLADEEKTIRWWQFSRRRALSVKVFALNSHFGM